MKAPEKCPFQVTLEGNEVMCFDPWFVRAIPRPAAFVLKYCRADFSRCPFYRIHGSVAPSGVVAL